jgi:hypothetical protein
MGTPLFRPDASLLIVAWCGVKQTSWPQLEPSNKNLRISARLDSRPEALIKLLFSLNHRLVNRSGPIPHDFDRILPLMADSRGITGR